MSNDLNDSYDLIFEGMDDDSPDAMRKIKATLIADLDMSIEDVQATLSKAKPVIRSAQSEAELQAFYKLIKSAGGKVLIVHRSGTTPDSESQDASPTMSISESGAFTFDFTEDASLAAKKSARDEDAPTRVHEITESDDMESLLNDPQFNEIAGADNVSSPATTIEPPPTQSDESKDEESTELPSLLDSLSLNDETAPIIPPSLTQVNKILPSPAAPPKDLDDAPLFDLAPSTHEDAPEKSPVHSQKEITPPKTIPSLLLDEENAPSPVPSTTDIPAEAAQALRDVARLQEQLEESISQIATSVESETELEENEFSLSLKEETLSTETSPTTPTPEGDALQAEGLSLTLDEPAARKAKDSKPVPTITPPSIATKEVETPKRPLPQPMPLASPQEHAPEVSAPSIPAKSSALTRKFRQFQLDIVIPIILGAALLGVANYFYFATPKPKEGIDALEQAAKNSVKAELEKEATRVPAAPKAVAFVGSATSETALFRATIAVLDSGKIANYTIEGSTPQPPPLTPEQIVNGAIGSPWIRKFEIGELPLHHAEDGSFTVKGASRAFVEFKDQRLRIPAQTVITGKTSADGAEISLTIQIFAGFSEMPTDLPDPGSVIKELPQGRFAIAARASMTLTRPTIDASNSVKK